MINIYQQQIQTILNDTGLFKHIFFKESSERALAEPSAGITYAGEESISENHSLIRVTSFSIDIRLLAGSAGNFDLLDTVLEELKVMNPRSFILSCTEKTEKIIHFDLTLSIPSPY